MVTTYQNSTRTITDSEIISWISKFGTPGLNALRTLVNLSENLPPYSQMNVIAIFEKTAKLGFYQKEQNEENPNSSGFQRSDPSPKYAVKSKNGNF